MMKPVYALLLLLLLLSLPVVAQQVTINIAWEYADFDGKLVLHEVKGHPRLWEMKSVKSLAQSPVGEEMAISSFTLQPGEAKRFALVVHNGSDQPRYFFAAPHVAHPAVHALGFNFKCLCISHAYTVGPRETWYRVVEFRLQEGFVGERLTLTHVVIGIDSERAKSFPGNTSQREF